MILDVPLDRLRQRTSVKWRAFDPDVLPLWVAESDVDLAPPIQRVLAEMVAGSDTGYVGLAGAAEAYAGFAGRRWDLAVDPDDVCVVPDILRGVLELIHATTEPGDGIVINPPVYHPFFTTITHAKRRVVEVPLLRDGSRGWTLDLVGLDAAFAAGTRVYLMCSPHNPVGRSWTGEELKAVAEVADRHGVLVICDEIHATMVYPERPHVPFASLDVGAARDSISLMSASKAWNLAGLKAGFAVASSPKGRGVLDLIGDEVSYGANHFGVAASRVALEECEAWLDELVSELDDRRRLLGSLIAQYLPGLVYRQPEATYLGWLDCAALGLDDPCQTFLENGRVALDSGMRFGTGGETFVRINFATSTAILTAAVRQMAAALP